MNWPIKSNFVRRGVLQCAQSVALLQDGRIAVRPYGKCGVRWGITTPVKVLCAVLFACASPALAADWIQFRGNAAQTGVASGKLTSKPQLLWKFKTKRGVTGAPAI